MAGFKHLGEILRQERIAKGYTQAGLAQSLKDIHSQFVSNWERGVCAPPSHCFHDLIDLLKISRKKIEKAMLEDVKEEIRAKVYGSSNKAA